MELRRHLIEGQVIPAHPLALTPARKLDERHQRALTRYYVASGAGGLAVGVHTTQFEIREPKHALLKPVLELAAATADEALSASPRPFVKVAGLCGRTAQAVAEAELALSLGYHAGLLSLGAWREEADGAIIEHCRVVADTIPVIGFYLQPAVGGRVLAYEFWCKFAEVRNVVAIKVAPFDRYQTIDVVRAVAESGRADIALYTGNDDNIVLDLLTDFEFAVGERRVSRHIAGGLLGHWAVWTRRAVELLEEVKEARQGSRLDAAWLSRAIAITDANAAFFDAANAFAGCIPGIHEVLRRQGLMRSIACLDPRCGLSSGQIEAIDRVLRSYPDLNDDDFVAEHLAQWLS